MTPRMSVYRRTTLSSRFATTSGQGTKRAPASNAPYERSLFHSRKHWWRWVLRFGPWSKWKQTTRLRLLLIWQLRMSEWKRFVSGRLTKIWRNASSMSVWYKLIGVAAPFVAPQKCPPSLVWRRSLYPIILLWLAMRQMATQGFRDVGQRRRQH